MNLRTNGILAAFLGLILITGMASMGVAERHAPLQASPGDSPAIDTVPSSLERLAASPRPLDRELASALQHQKRSLAALYARFEAAPDQAAAMAIQLEIRALQKSTEVQLLQIQAKHARLAGREDLAMQIEHDIRTLQHPAESLEKLRRPEPRPAPADEQH